MKEYDVIVIGSGLAGSTASIYTKRGGLKTLLITGHLRGGLLTTTGVVENFPSYPKGVEGTVLAYNNIEQATRLGVEILENTNVIKVDNNSATLDTGENIKGKTIIIATGANPKHLEIDSVKDMIEEGLISLCATCDGWFYQDKTTYVIGGGDTACEEALYLSNICSKVTMVLRSDKFRASNILVERVKNTKNIDIFYNEEIEKTTYSAHEGITIIFKSGNVETTNGLFLAIGHTPQTDYLKDFIELDEQGYVIKNNLPENFFVAGDCEDKVYRQGVTASASGCKAGMDVINYLNTLK